jgi:hypothetical protein
MSEIAKFERDTKGIKFTRGYWTNDNKIKVDGSNVIRSLRAFKNQIRAEGTAAKAAGLQTYPATQIAINAPNPEAWNPVGPDGEKLLSDDSPLKPKLQYKVYEDYINEVKTSLKEDEKLYELLKNDVCSAESLGRLKAHADYKGIDSKKHQRDWVSLYNLIVKTHVIEIGGESKEAQLVNKFALKKEIENLRQAPGISTERHFEDHEDLIYKAKMVGLEI